MSAGSGKEVAPAGWRMLRLERMVVSPEVQGQGIGSSSLRAAIHALEEEASASGLRTATLLTTQESRNVTFYGRLGFEVSQEEDAYGVKHWILTRRSDGSQAAAPDGDGQRTA